MKILVVDDSALMRDMCRQAIETHADAGTCEVVEAENGQAALDLLAQTSVDLLFLDWNMPVLDGLQVVRHLRAAGNQVPVVMVSAVTEPVRVMEAIEAGVNDYLEKPIKGSELWQRVKGQLNLP